MPIRIPRIPESMSELRGRPSLFTRRNISRLRQGSRPQVRKLEASPLGPDGLLIRQLWAWLPGLSFALSPLASCDSNCEALLAMSSPQKSFLDSASAIAGLAEDSGTCVELNWRTERRARPKKWPWQQ